MKRIAHKFKNFEEAEAWEIEQALNMTPDERIRIARELQKRVFGKNVPDIREATRMYVSRSKDNEDLKYLLELKKRKSKTD